MLTRLLVHLRRQWIGVLALLIALGTGTTYAANTVFSTDIVNGEVMSVDIGNNQVRSVDIRNGEVSVLDTNKTIPSGATITGAFHEYEDDSATTGATAQLQFGVDFNGLKAPAPLTDADVQFDDTGISAAVADDGQESNACTGGIGIPTAPPGKVCIYLFYEEVEDGFGFAENLGLGTGFSQADDKGFRIAAAGSGIASLAGTWAYTAP
jgi:hypothetical protein